MIVPPSGHLGSGAAGSACWTTPVSGSAAGSVGSATHATPAATPGSASASGSNARDTFFAKEAMFRILLFSLSYEREDTPTAAPQFVPAFTWGPARRSMFAGAHRPRNPEGFPRVRLRAPPRHRAIRAEAESAPAAGDLRPAMLAGRDPPVAPRSGAPSIDRPPGRGRGVGDPPRRGHRRAPRRAPPRRGGVDPGLDRAPPRRGAPGPLRRAALDRLRPRAGPPAGARWRLARRAARVRAARARRDRGAGAARRRGRGGPWGRARVRRDGRRGSRGSLGLARRLRVRGRRGRRAGPGASVAAARPGSGAQAGARHPRHRSRSGPSLAEAVAALRAGAGPAGRPRRTRSGAQCDRGARACSPRSARSARSSRTCSRGRARRPGAVARRGAASGGSRIVVREGRARATFAERIGAALGGLFASVLVRARLASFVGL